MANYGGGKEKGGISVIDTESLEEIRRIAIERYPRAIAVIERKK